MNVPTLPEGFRFVVAERTDYYQPNYIVVSIEKFMTVSKRRFFQKHTADEWVPVYTLQLLGTGSDKPADRVLSTMEALKMRFEDDHAFASMLGEYPPRTEL